MAEVTLTGVGKVFADGTRAVKALDLEIGDGEFMVLVGPSGCGKTTALRMVAGLEDITEGEVRIGDRVVNDLEPRRRDVAMVFQNYALYPHISVYDNMAFGLKMRRTPKGEIRRRVEEIARVLDLVELLGRKPAALSGGQRQRVAMGRAIVRQPQAFLMDEPLSNLDAKLRVQMRAEIARIQKEVAATTIYVTHDQVEAMTMGDRVCVMRKGELQQVGPPRELYDEPRNLFVASFIGSPAMNLVQAGIERDGDGLALTVGEHSLAVPAATAAERPALAGYVGRRLALGIRPEHVQDPLFAPATFTGRMAGTVRTTEMLGAEVLVHVEVAAEPVVSTEVLEVAADVDAAAASDLRHEALVERTTFVGRFDRSSNASAGRQIEFAVSTAGLQFFDLDSGLAVTT